ncbi:hypothetical protein M408DRAFT_26882 [Serendipita vermifera MAFF 305830]|uniref:Uncharacterized protein n=1 Tax=Serendipita vermifera MAFF 305830 TaxID=933852 RepID=A0A0C2X5N0_SERVB|nr:hypothetical protein M408DRAFT_26882 [Serendipita vermifera MAFF 305830]
MENHSHIINAAIDVYGREHAPSQDSVPQPANGSDSDSDATPKAKPIPLLSTSTGYSYNANNSWKDLGMLEPVGNNGMRGIAQQLPSQPIERNKFMPGTSESSTGTFDTIKRASEKKKIAYPVPTRRAPPPPTGATGPKTGVAAPKSHSMKKAFEGTLRNKEENSSVPAGFGHDHESDMEALNHLMLNLGPSDDKKVQKSYPGTRQAND